MRDQLGSQHTGRSDGVVTALRVKVKNHLGSGQIGARQTALDGMEGLADFIDSAA